MPSPGSCLEMGGVRRDNELPQGATVAHNRALGVPTYNEMQCEAAKNKSHVFSY